MINFHIPDFCIFYNLNNKLIDLIYKYTECFYEDINIGSIYGSFPGAIWNGGRPYLGTSDKRSIELIIDNFNSKNIPLRFTFTNSLITKEHLNDSLCNYIMEVGQTGMNGVIINNDILENYLRSKYPNYNYILSTTAVRRGLDNINIACEKYDMVVLDYNDNKNLDILNNILFKNKVEFLCNEMCIPNCQYRKYHYETISDAQIKNDLSICFKCPNNNLIVENFLQQEKSSTLITPKELYNFYSKNGFSNFKLQGRGYPLEASIDNYITYMVKPEYVKNIYDELTNSCSL